MTINFPYDAAGLVGNVLSNMNHLAAWHCS